MADKRYFTNTYVTSSGRKNYLKIDYLEDPLFTSFTFDIDFVSSPLFYTINYNDYGYPNVESIGTNIEASLDYMYMNEISDDGFEILPQLSAFILDDNKLGFGLQQNVYMDMPLYGATEYIYMVDKRNGVSSQNDVKFDNNRFVEYSGNPNTLNGYKLGESIKSIVNDSDKVWAENQKKQNDEQISICNEILEDENVKVEHENNVSELNSVQKEYDNAIYTTVDNKNYTEADLLKEINEYKNKASQFEQFKRDIVAWANATLLKYQNIVISNYNTNACVQEICSKDYIDGTNKDDFKSSLSKKYGSNYVSQYLYGDSKSFLKEITKLYKEIVKDNDSFLKENGNDFEIRESKIIEKFIDKLKIFNIYDESNKSLKGNVVNIYKSKTSPEWASSYKTKDRFKYFNDDVEDACDNLESIMQFQCDFNASFYNFSTDTINDNDNELAKYQNALNDLRSKLYGTDENNEIADKSNPNPNSIYGRYLAAKDKCENDDYSQAEKTKSMSQSGLNEMINMMNIDNHSQNIIDNNYNKSVQNDVQPLEINRKKSINASQTVLDMLGFISGMKKMILEYPYIIQGVTGLDTAYKNHYGIKDPYLGSGDDKITLTCLESLDLRVSSMFNRYFNAIYDRQYRRERVPINLRRFNCSIYVHDVRNFVSRMRETMYNRILELTDMYFSVIEFRFYDCEIVPEETGNIFDNISNEAPSEMKKTNFTFTYGNCVVNFIPQSEVKSYNKK